MTIRRPTTLLATVLLTIGMLAVPAAAHDNVHQGRGGVGLTNAGHAFAPVAPLGGVTDCAAFEDALADGPLPAGPPPPGD